MQDMCPNLNPTDLIFLDPSIVTKEKLTLFPAITLEMAHMLRERLADFSQELKKLDGGVQFSDIVPVHSPPSLAQALCVHHCDISSSSCISYQALQACHPRSSTI